MLTAGAKAIDCRPSEAKAVYLAMRKAASKLMSNVHSDDLAVDKFAAAMKEKMAKKRADGRAGWESCPEQYLNAFLRDHLAKGDPVDVGNFAMMLWNIGQKTIAPPICGDDARQKAFYDFTQGWDLRFLKRETVERSLLFYSRRLLLLRTKISNRNLSALWKNRSSCKAITRRSSTLTTVASG